MQDAVSEIFKSQKIEDTLTYWLRNKDGRASRAKKKPLRELIDDYLGFKGEDRILIHYLLSKEVVGSTPIDDPDMLIVKGESMKGWIAEVLERDYDDDVVFEAAQEIRRLYMKVKELQAIIDSL